MFELYTIAIAIIAVIGVIWAVLWVEDTLHPLVYLLPMVGFIYVYLPVDLYHREGLLYYFTYDEITFVQGYNLLCVAALALGCYLSSRKYRHHRTAPVPIKSAYWQRRMKQFAFFLGGIGLLAWAYQITNVGGLVAAYSHVKGGGRAGSGYIRDARTLVVPAIVFFYLSRTRSSWTWRDWGIIGLLSLPVLLRGLLAARRGPTSVALGALVGGWYLARRSRPRFLTVVIGGVGVGLLLMILVTFRSQIYLGSDFFSGDAPAPDVLIERALEDRTDANLANEFMYGTYAVLDAREDQDFWWGRRYLTQIFVRPIPSSVWPNKYADTGMGAIRQNAGMLGPEGLRTHPEVPDGAAPGFAGSAFVEWAWGGVVLVFLIGWLYGYAWQQSVRRGGIWTVHYTVLLALSVFFVAQSFLAVLFRYLLMVIPSAVLWVWAEDDYVKRLRRSGSRMIRMKAGEARGA